MSSFSQVCMSPKGPHLSKVIQGFWRMSEWNMTPQQRLNFIKELLELGITTMDHASVYGIPPAETIFGEVLKLEPGLRNQMEIISKCGINPVRSELDHRVSHYDTRKKSIIASVEESLSRLGIENLDVLLIHRLDYLLEADEVAEAFFHLKKEGKVEYFGVSNFTPSQFSLLQSRLDEPLITNQVEINPINFQVTEDGTLDQLQKLRIRPMAWSCLAGGRIFTEASDQIKRIRITLNELKEELNADSIDQVVYAWIMRLPSKPVVISGSGKIERTKEAVKALKLSMNPEQWYRLWVASKGHGVP